MSDEIELGIMITHNHHRVRVVECSSGLRAYYCSTNCGGRLIASDDCGGGHEDRTQGEYVQRLLATADEAIESVLWYAVMQGTIRYLRRVPTDKPKKVVKLSEADWWHDVANRGLDPVCQNLLRGAIKAYIEGEKGTPVFQPSLTEGRFGFLTEQVTEVEFGGKTLDLFEDLGPTTRLRIQERR